MDDILAARAAAAARYPVELVDTMGRPHPCVPRLAILRGDWDAGSLVRDEIARLSCLAGEAA